MKVKPLWEISRNKKVTIDLVGFQEFDYAPRIDGKVITGLYIIKKVSAHNNYFRYVNEEMVFMKYLPDLALKSGSILGDYSFLDDSSKIMSENNLSSKFNTVITRSMMPRILEGLKSTEERKKGNLEFSRIIKGIETIFQSNVSAKFIFEYDMLSKEIALDLYKKHDSDILFVYFAGTDVFGHNYYFDGWYLKDEEGQQEQIYRYYEVIDGYIGEFLSKRDEDTTFFIISDHGLQNLTMGQYLSALPHLPPHTKKGIFMAYGKNIKKEKIKDAQIVDITPTILYMYDQPIAEDFDGKVLLDIFDEEYTKNKVAKTIDTYEKQN
jgi:predicted AlkP superfamily pyrophosphatase or phosphodiesterase